MEHVDVLIVGAGLSGIGAAVHLQRRCPRKTFAILEGRATSGGTWDLFRYPGVRSDSDMYTLGYAFKPWKSPKAIADGAAILAYVRETATEHAIDAKIRFRHKVVAADWSSDEARWTVTIAHDAGGAAPETVTMTCNFLLMCSGYYSYAGGHRPKFAGEKQFQGRIVHPQEWPADLDTVGKRVVVIGSGATAVTLVPSMAQTAAHVTMLQRSPTYVVSRPEEDEVANKLKARLPAMMAYGIVRWRNVLRGMYIYRLCKTQPDKIKAMILGGVRQELGPDYDVATHFTPRYRPWDQRLCLVPDGDLFKSIRAGRASVVTDHIETFTPTGIKLESGQELAADVIVTATGLELVALGGLALRVDGAKVDLSKTMNYKGMMYSDVPNLAAVMGYTNASWTLKADLICGYVCRLLNHMDRRGATTCMPHNCDPTISLEPFNDFSSGYVQRAIDKFPKQGSRKPWRLYQNYARDMLSLKLGSLDDGAMTFSSPSGPAKGSVRPASAAPTATPA